MFKYYGLPNTVGHYTKICCLDKADIPYQLKTKLEWFTNEIYVYNAADKIPHGTKYPNQTVFDNGEYTTTQYCTGAATLSVGIAVGAIATIFY